MDYMLIAAVHIVYSARRSLSGSVYLCRLPVRPSPSVSWPPYAVTALELFLADPSSVSCATVLCIAAEFEVPVVASPFKAVLFGKLPCGML